LEMVDVHTFTQSDGRNLCMYVECCAASVDTQCFMMVMRWRHSTQSSAGPPTSRRSTVSIPKECVSVLLFPSSKFLSFWLWTDLFEFSYSFVDFHLVHNFF
jgi:hypothetical protein